MKHPVRSATTDKHLSQAPEDHRCSMKFTISRSDKCFHRFFFLTVDTQFPFAVEFGWIPFFYQITISRDLAQLHDKMSTQHPQLTANEKAQTEVFSCLKMADSRAASMVFGPMRPGGARAVKERAKLPWGRLMVRMPNSQEGHQVTRRSPNSH